MRRLLFLFCILVLIPTVQAACPGNFSTDQIITSAEDTWTNCQITGTANIIVKNNGILHIDGNSIITMNPSTAYQYQIIVEDNGIIYINDTTITSADKTWPVVTSTTPHSRILLRAGSICPSCYPTLKMNNGTITYLGVHSASNADLYSITFNRNSEDSYIKNSSFHETQGIYLVSRNVDINDNNFSNIGTTDYGTTNCCGTIVYNGVTNIKAWQLNRNRFGLVVTGREDKESFLTSNINGMEVRDTITYTGNVWPANAHQLNMYGATRNLSVINYTCDYCIDPTFNNVNVRDQLWENLTLTHAVSGLGTMWYGTNITFKNVVISTGASQTPYPDHILNAGGTTPSYLTYENLNVSGQTSLTKFGFYMFGYHYTRFINWTWTLGSGSGYSTIMWSGNNGLMDNLTFNNTHDSTKSIINVISSTNLTARDVSLSSVSSGNLITIGNGGYGNHWININDGGSSKVGVSGTGKYEKYQYIDIYVQDNNSNPVSGASVSIQNADDVNYPSINRNGVNKTVFTTSVDGHTALPSDKDNSAAILEYIKNSTTLTYYSHNITASKANYTTSTVFVSANDTWYRSNLAVAPYTVTLTILGSSPDPINNYIPPNPIINQSSYDIFDVTHTWQPGVGNVTDSFNVSWNGTWTNGSTNTSMTGTVSPHGYGNITVWAYNSSGSGTLSTGNISASLQVGNNIPVQASIGNQIVVVGNYLNFTVSATDLDLDTITYGTNATKGTFNTVTGVYSWLPTGSDVGTYNWYFNASDGYGGVDTETITVSVLNTSNVTGYINITSTVPCSGCDVYLANTNGSYLSKTTTDSNGLYSFSGVTISTYFVYAVQVNESSNKSSNFTMGISDTWQNITLILQINKTIGQNSMINFSTSSDFDGDAMTFSTNDTTNCHGFSSITGIGTCSFGVVGTYTVKFGVMDINGFYSNKTIIFNVSAAPPTYSVSGFVNSSSGAGIPGVIVTIDNQTATTTSNGSYTVIGVANGTYTASYSKPGYDTTYKEITVNGTNADSQNIVMNIISAISNYVTSTCASTMNWGIVGSSLLIVLIIVMAGGLAIGFLTGTLKMDTFPIKEFVFTLFGIVVIGSIGVAIIGPIITAVGCP